MENLEIVNANTNITAREVFQGNVITYNFMYTSNAKPTTIIFSVQPESEVVQTNPTQPMPPVPPVPGTQLLSGSYHSALNQLDLKAYNHIGTHGAMIDYIHQRCQEIVLSYTPETAEEV